MLTARIISQCSACKGFSHLMVHLLSLTIGLPIQVASPGLIAYGDF